SLVGSLTGAYLLLHLPEDAFETIVPVLLVVALVMVVGQPYLSRYLKERSLRRAHEAGIEHTTASVGDRLSTGRYLAVLLVVVVTTVSASTYIIVGHDRINWIAVVCIAIGSLIGGYFGARIGRRFSPVLLRSVIVILGIVAIWRILTL